MTAKEKAKELVAKYTRIEDDTFFYWEPANDRRYLDEEVFNHAIKCSKIAVDEKRELLQKLWDNVDNIKMGFAREFFLKEIADIQEVKTELEKL